MRQKREDGAELMNEEFEEGTYTNSVLSVLEKSSQAQEKKRMG